VTHKSSIRSIIYAGLIYSTFILAIKIEKRSTIVVY
jgi:hypothetical protein